MIMHSPPSHDRAPPGCTIRHSPQCTIVHPETEKPETGKRSREGDLPPIPLFEIAGTEGDRRKSTASLKASRHGGRTSLGKPGRPAPARPMGRLCAAEQL